jgi:hypothetical protein
MRRNRLSDGWTREARRSPIDLDKVERYRAEVAEVHESFSCGRILNANESFSFILHLPQKMAPREGQKPLKLKSIEI